jgi:hypothetical protein
MLHPYKILILSVNRWQESLVLSTWALQSGQDIFLLNPDHQEEETRALEHLAARLPCRFVDACGAPGVTASLKSITLPEDLNTLSPAALKYPQLKKHFGTPKGLVFCSGDSVQKCLFAAVLAVRMGYALLPYSCREELGHLLQEVNRHHEPVPELPQIVLDAGGLQEEESKFPHVHFLQDDTAAFRYIERGGADYLLLMNSADITGPEKQGSSLGEMQVKGLSLLAPLVASYRKVYPFDAATLQPEPLEIEEKLNARMQDQGIAPAYKATLASPGYLPFIVQKNRAIGSETEEMVRDMHLRLNDDLFFDVAEGRLFQSTPGGLSLQILSTKYYHELKKPENKALVVTTPHVEKGIIFATDEALIGCQLEPLLTEAGIEVTLLEQKESNPEAVSKALKDSTYFLYTGHGGPESLNTHGRYLTRDELPFLPPLVAYASACSTTYLRPHLFSASDGLDWEELDIDGRDIIGLAMVEKGAVCFVGGATTEDLQYSTSIYSIFMEALLIKGFSVGEALLETQNFISLYAQILKQKAPGTWKDYTFGTANAIHQQILLGDPALIPCPGPKNLPFRKEIREIPGGCSITVTIPEKRWQRVKSGVNPTKPTRSYYKSREMEVISPFGTGVVSWGDFYPVAPDADGITDTAIMSSFLHMSLDLPPGIAPLSLHLTDAAASRRECLACHSEDKDFPAGEAKALFEDFRMPFLMLPSLRLDMRKGWPFALETRRDATRVHWLVPLLVIDERRRTAHKAEKLSFSLKTAPGAFLTGQVKVPGFTRPGCLVVTAGLLPEDGGTSPRLNALAQSLTRKDGSFKIFCAREAKAITVDQSFPLFDLPSDFKPFSAGTWQADFQGRADISLSDVEYTRLKGKVIDSMTAKPVNGAILRVWRGKYDPHGDPLLEAFAGEATTGSDGSFLLLLAPGDYILSAAARDGSTLYKSSHRTMTIEGDGESHHIMMLMDQAVYLQGRITFQDPPLLFPATVKVRRYPEKDKIETLAMVPARKDGTFECIVSFQDRFCIVIEEEGRPPLRDTNQGKGYRLEPGEALEREYRL